MSLVKTFSKITVFILCLSFIIGPLASSSRASERGGGSSDVAPKKLVFAIDGFSFEAFQFARSKGLFKQFDQSGRHVAPYPAISEPSWTEMMGGKTLFPLEGNVKSIEGKFFDVDSMTTKDDPRNIYARYANSYNFMRAFDYYFNPYLEGLMYFPNDSVAKMELESTEKEIYDNFTGDHFIAYMSSVDATAHTQPEKLHPLLSQISALVDRVSDHYAKSGTPIEMWIISDHGNVGKFHEGEKEPLLDNVVLDDAVSRSGLELVETGSLTKPNQISMPILALGSMGNVYFKDLSRRREFAKNVVLNPGVEMATWLEVTPTERYVDVLSSTGAEARVYWGGFTGKENSYAYVPVTGNPLAIDEKFQSTGSAKNWVSDSEIFEATKSGPYPDSLFRLMRSASKQVSNTPDLIVNLKDGHCFQGDFSKYVTMVRTHGSLTARSSLGLIASDRGAALPSHVRSENILSTIGISPAQAFHQIDDLFHKPAHDVLEKVKTNAPQGILTRISELTSEMIFMRLTKALIATMDVIPSKDIHDLMAGLATQLSTTSQTTDAVAPEAKLKAQSISDIVAKLDTLEALKHLDPLIALKDIDPTTKTDDIIARVKSTLYNTPGLAPLSGLDAIFSGQSSSSAPFSNSTGDALRRTVMKLYTAPFLLNEILDLPEGNTVPETRNLEFADTWVNSKKAVVTKDPGVLLKDKTLAQTLFSAVFEERKLSHGISPATTPLIYNPMPKDVTVVFVPGIYNELFDTEIFSRGLSAIQGQLGLRVLYTDVDGRCSTSHNALDIVARLKQDTDDRLARGYEKPRYLILGYSKGGVDATEALLLDEEFTRSQILGLVSIAAPHQGTSVLEIADVPAIASENLVMRPMPEACRDDTAAKSLLRVTRGNFWSKNINKLVGLTRYYSVSFVSTVEESNPWMKITKQIAHFGSPNDGVVTLESSHFPDALQAVDLGTMHADHLAGILASNFPQAAFLESVMVSLFELHALDRKSLVKWYDDVSQTSPFLVSDYHQRQMAAEVLRAGSTLLNAVGPFPDAGNDSSPDWFDVISREDGFLKTPLHCAGEKDAAEFVKKIEALPEMSKGSETALKHFTAVCAAGGAVTIKIRTLGTPLWKLWEHDQYESKTVTTMGELVNFILEKGMASGLDLLNGSGGAVQLPKSNRPLTVLPENTFKWSDDFIIDLKSFEKMMRGVRVTPMDPVKNSTGLQMIFDHQTFLDFRKEYEFSYESTSTGGMDDNPVVGYSPKLDKIGDNYSVVARMKSKDNSIRMTTTAFRFKPSEFSKLALELKVLHGVPGADPMKGGSLKDDSAFQLWFTLRNIHDLSDRATFAAGTQAKIFGYYWADPNAAGKMPAPGTLFENDYSNKNFVITVLPEAWQIALEGGQGSLGKWFNFNRNLADDLHKAFPNDNIDDLEVVGITIQTDSNDMHGESEAYFKQLTIDRSQP